MVKVNQKQGQAAVELAIFGAILIFILGSIVRTAVGSSYTQNQDFKAMRMAMLSSWQGTLLYTGAKAKANTAHNSAQVLFVEDRLSPDNGKYGDLDRNPFMTSGSGTFTYNLFYPLTDNEDIMAGIPIMDVYINGQHFPFAMGAYKHETLHPGKDVPCPAAGSPSTSDQTAGDCPGPNPTAAQLACMERRNKRNEREWGLGCVTWEMFDDSRPGVLPVATPVDDPIPADCVVTPKKGKKLTKSQKTQEQNCADKESEIANAHTIYTDLGNADVLDTNNTDMCSNGGEPINPNISLTALQNQSSTQWKKFESLYRKSFPKQSKSLDDNTYFPNIVTILLSGQYKFFYTIVANPGGADQSKMAQPAPSGGGNPPPPPPLFETVAPSCTDSNTAPIGVGLPDNIYFGLCRAQYLKGYNDDPTTDGYGASTNSNAVMQYDLWRNADYSGEVKSTFKEPHPIKKPSQIPTQCTTCNRNYIAWQWAAAEATSASAIGLNSSSNTWPTFDIDGRLKEVTIYNLVGNTVSFEDPDAGDIDQNWDLNSCGTKPGLQQSAQIFTFTKSGTYLEIKEGKLLDPETGQVVRSADKRDSVDVIQRTIQLSNNTGRFCSGSRVIGPCVGGSLEVPCVQNPVEVCATSAGGCFLPGTVAQTCYDINTNRIFVRSRLADKRGRFWMTDASGQLQVQ